MDGNRRQSKQAEFQSLLGTFENILDGTPKWRRSIVATHHSPPLMYGH
jgi:hypothetical protein